MFIIYGHKLGGTAEKLFVPVVDGEFLIFKRRHA
jgi:hypothetical protein